MVTGWGMGVVGVAGKKYKFRHKHSTFLYRRCGTDHLDYIRMPTYLASDVSGYCGKVPTLCSNLF